MNGVGAINQVATTFDDLSGAAQKASVEIARLAAVTAKGLDLSGAAEQIGELFRDLLEPITPRMEKVATLAEKVGAALSDLASGNLAKMNKAVGKLSDAMGEVSKSNQGNALAKFGQQVGLAAAGMVAGTVGIAGAITGFVGTVSRVSGLVVGAFSALVSGAVGLAKSLLNIPGWLQAAINPIQKMFASIAPFVGALNPAYVFRFQSGMLDLQAVMGRAMVPFAEGLTRLTRNFADMFTVVSGRLQPVFAVLGQVVEQVGTQVFAVFGAALIQLGPSLQKFATGVGGALTQLVGAVAEIVPKLIEGFAILVDWLASNAVPAIGRFVASLVKGTNGIANSFKWLVDIFDGLGTVVDLLALGINRTLVAIAKAVNWITEKIPFVGGKTFSQESIDQWDKAAYARKDRMLGQDPETLQQEKDTTRFQANLGGVADAIRKMAGNGASLGAANRGSAFTPIAELGRNLMQQSFGQTPVEEKQLNVLEKIAQGVWQMADGKGKAGPMHLGGAGVQIHGGAPSKFNRIDGDPNGI